MSFVVFRPTMLDAVIPRVPRRLIASSSFRRSKPAKTNTSSQVSSPEPEHLSFPSTSKHTVREPLPTTSERPTMSALVGTSRSRKTSANVSTADVTPAVDTSHAVSSPSPGGAAPITPTAPDQPFPAPYSHSPPLGPPRSPVTNWVLASPLRTSVVLKLGDWLGYGSPKQVAGRRSKIIYNICSEVAQGPEQKFWYDSLSLPPSFQSWFTITNLHVWLATVRLRSLPPSHGRHFIQALIDHYFFDVEDRLRAVLGKKAPERLVTRHMKLFREQWAGLGIACDIALITGDKDMASAMWRNLLGARGARGIAYPDAVTTSENPTGTPSALSPSSPASGAPKMLDDPSTGGVTDFEGTAIDKYVMYPQLMLALTSYLRRELVRLEGVSDVTILGGEGRGMRESLVGPAQGLDGTSGAIDLTEAWRFGSVKDAARKVDAQIDNL